MSATHTADGHGDDALDAHELEALWHAIDSDTDDTSSGLLRFVAPPPTPTPSSSSSSASPYSSSAASSPSPSSVTSMAVDDAAAAATGPPKRKPRQFTAAQVDMRRKRNRDSMRRVRQRKQVEVEHLRQQMELLEDKLDELRLVRDQTNAPGPPLDAFAPTTVPTTMQRPPRSKADVQELLEGIKALQSEQVRLHNAILSHQQVAASLAQLVHESDSLTASSVVAPPPSPTPTLPGLFQTSDEFQWVNAVLPLLPPLARVFDLVRESYLDIVQHMAHADASLNAPNHVLGWTDRRAVSGVWADFLFSKTFAHEAPDELAARTWRMLTNMDQNHGFQSKGLTLKVLEQLNDDTLVMARSSYSPRDRTYYSSIYVLLRVETADGYVFGGRTVAPLPEYAARMPDALGDDRVYVHMVYGLMFTRTGVGQAQPIRSWELEVVETSSPSASPVSGSAALSPPPVAPTTFADRGVHVRYGGRIGNGGAGMAQAWAMDVLLAALRWENSCVKPLKLLQA